MIVLARESLEEWEGGNQPSQGRDVQATSRFGDPGPSATDYDRACDVKDYLALLPVGRDTGLVIGGEDFSTAWCESAEGRGGTFICWGYAEDEADVLKALEEGPHTAWVPLAGEFRVCSGPTCLFDSAHSGRDIENAMRLPATPRVNKDAADLFMEIGIAPGAYVVETAEHKSGRTWLILHRLRVIPGPDGGTHGKTGSPR